MKNSKIKRSDWPEWTTLKIASTERDLTGNLKNFNRETKSCWWHSFCRQILVEKICGHFLWPTIVKMLVTKMAKIIANILKLSPTHFVSNIRRQYWCIQFEHLCSVKKCSNSFKKSLIEMIFVSELVVDLWQIPRNWTSEILNLWTFLTNQKPQILIGRKLSSWWTSLEVM